MKYNLPVILLRGTVLIPQNELKLEFILNDVLELCRKELGKDYHMCITLNSLTKPEWVVYKHYDDPDMYFSPDNKAILSSKNFDTIEDLVQFTLKNRKEK